MKRFWWMVPVCAVLATGTAHAQVFGQFTGAQPVEVNARMFGGYVQFSKNVLALMGQLRLSFYPGVDFGIQGGLARQEFAGGSERTTVRLGGDLKYELSHPTESYPYSISIGGALGVQTGDNFSILTIGPTIVGSRSLATGQSASLTPYVGAGMMFSNVNVEELDESDFWVPLRLGTVLRLGPGADVVGELLFRIGDDFDDDLTTTIGINVPF